MKNNRITKYLFGLTAFAIILYLAIHTNKINSENLSELNEETEEQLNQINEYDFSLTQIEDNKNNDLKLNELEENNDPEIIDEQNIFINSIKIAKEIDRDETSETYREPINSFKTITTLDKNVTKEINYYPSFYIWTSINTENVSLKKLYNKNDTNSENLNMTGSTKWVVEPVELLMSVKCNNEIIEEVNYQINARSPRWREWIEIDLTKFETESFKGIWNIEIINKENKKVLESRSFTFQQDFDSYKIKQTAGLIKK